MHRTITRILVVVALLVSLLGIRQVSAADTVPFVNVSIVEGYVGQYEEYHIQFLLDREVKAEETLSIVFDDNINLALYHNIAAGDMTLDGIPAGDSAHWSGHILTVHTPTVLSAGTVHELTILRGAMVQNPQTAMHVQLLLRDDAAGTTLASNYYGISTVTHVSPVSLTVETQRADRLTVVLRFRTGRTGALTGNPMAPRAFGAPAASPDTISLQLSPALSRIWDQSGAVVAWFSTSGMVLGASRLKLVSTSDGSKSQSGKYRKQATYELDTDVAALTEVLVHLEFDGFSIPIQLTTDDFVLVWTSKEPTVVRIPLTGVPDPVPVSIDGNPAPEPDTTAPVITWNVQRSAFSSRLLTLNICITEDNLDEAYFVRDDDDSLHTGLAVGDTGLMMINRTGIKGMIIAIDKAGNTTSVPVDIPAPAAS